MELSTRDGDSSTREEPPPPRRTPLTGVEHGSCETTQHPELEPIFTELAQRWIDAGLALPGQHDEEWTILTRSPWPAR